MLLQHCLSRLLLGGYPNLLTMSELLKTMDQLAKEEALLSKIRCAGTPNKDYAIHLMGEGATSHTF